MLVLKTLKFLHIFKIWCSARCQWLLPVILATLEAEVRRIMVEASPWQKFRRPYLENTQHKKRLVEWAKC
jgi:hypothetical protein